MAKHHRWKIAKIKLLYFKSIEQTITFKLCFISQFKCNGLHDSNFFSRSKCLRLYVFLSPNLNFYACRSKMLKCYAYPPHYVCFGRDKHAHALWIKVKSKYTTEKVIIGQLTFHFQAQFLYKIISQFPSFLFWIRLSQGLGKQNRFPIGCDVFWVKVFVSLCSHSTGGLCAFRNGWVLRRLRRTMVKG